MLDWTALVRLSDSALARLDVVQMNATCALGLPGMTQVNGDGDAKIVDAMAASCRRFTDHAMSLFHQGKCDYPDSQPKFRIQAMITHLQRDLHLVYHPDRRAEDSIFKPEDSFLHGLLHGGGGTCGSMSVLYVAVGRRLGYPLLLVSAKCHLFCRWEGLEQFNIEGAGQGISFHPDEHYRNGTFAMPPETVKACGYLESLSPREEVAGF